jgi:hypothetical protein
MLAMRGPHVDSASADGNGGLVRWEERLFELFDDLDQQAEGLALAERDIEVAELGRAEYAGVDLASRLHASVGGQVRMAVSGLGVLEARLCAAGQDWCLLSNEPLGPAREWVVRFAAVAMAEGLSERAAPEPARPVTARLGLGSALRRLAESREPVVLTRLDGATTRGRLRRVGADFVEVVPDGDRPGVILLPFGHLAAARSGLG